MVADIIGGLGAAAEQPGLGTPRVDDTLDAQDGADMILPVSVGEFVGRIEDRHGAAFEAAAAIVTGSTATDWFCRIGDLGDGLQQGRLVALDLDDQTDIGLSGDIEMFF